MIIFTAVKKNQYEFKDWMDSRGLKTKDIAESLHVDEATVRNWRSSGVPPRRLPHVAKYMAEWTDPTATILPTISDDAVKQFAAEAQNLVLHPTPSQFDSWNSAFKVSEAPTLTQWAIDGLTEMATTYKPLLALPKSPAPGKTRAKKGA